MGAKGGDPKIPVTDYHMSIHLGICVGPVDLLAIYTGEKLAWEGEQTEQGDILIDKTELYGGPEKEGGVQGTAHFLPGLSNQEIPEHIAARHGLTTATMPSYRGLASIFFHGGTTFADTTTGPTLGFGTTTFGRRNLFGSTKPNGVKGKPGFYWQSNNPTLKGIWATVRNIPLTLGSAGIAQIGPDANPAHMIYECLVNEDVGMGCDPLQIDTASFTAAAQTLYDEEFGLSMQFVQQGTIEQFITEIIDHIQASFFLNPQTGLLTLTLLRDDYNVGEAPLFTPSNCTVTKFARKTGTDLINEISVTWTNPENEQEEKVTDTDLAGVAAAGGIIHDDRNYYGVRNQPLALRLLSRDKRTAAAPLAKVEMETDRTAWDSVPGQVIRLTYPDHGLDETVFRVGPINYGKIDQNKIVVNLTEEIFSFEPGAYRAPTYTSWQDTSAEPEELDFKYIVTLPFYITQAIDDTLEHPDVFGGFLGAHSNSDVYGFDLAIEETQPDGSEEYELSGFKSVMPYAELDSDGLAQEATSTFAPPTASDGSTVIPGQLIFIGDGTEDEIEIAMVVDEDSNSNGLWVINRGVLDTTPKAWPAGTPMWYIDPTVVFFDRTFFAPGVETNFKLLTRTSLGRLDDGDAAVTPYTFTERPHLPQRPANVSVDTVLFADEAAPVDAISHPTITVGWAHRNRLTEDSVVLPWTDGTVTPEAGQTTTVYVEALDGTVWATHDGETGTSLVVNTSEFEAAVGVIRVTSKRDGFESLQGHRIVVQVADSGYGFDYGLDYGGS